MKNERKIICVVGPTASGKTRLAVDLAKKFNGEIISADSRQIFRGLTIGTGKDLHEYDNIVYHLIDIQDPEEEFTLFDFLELACKKIEEIFNKGKLPIVVGGTGLYVQALVEGFEINNKRSHPEGTEGSIQIDSSLIAQNDILQYSRVQLEKMSKGELQEVLIDLDEEAFLTIDLDNPYRMIRAIEKAEGGEQIAKEKPNFDVLQIAIKLPREELHDKIDRRVEVWFREGFYGEVKGLMDRGVSLGWLNRIGLEYKILANYIANNHKQNDEAVFEDMKNRMKAAIRQYARRQITWFSRFPEIVWVNSVSEAEKVAGDYLDKV